jgi:uncharacterized protein
MDTQAIEYCEKQTGIKSKQIKTVLELFEQDCTVPFIARYRKEATGNLDETQIRDIDRSFNDFTEREHRRSYILEALEKQGVLNPDLERSVKKATSLNQLEEIYAPYKSKKKTKAMLAREAGLEPLAEDIYRSDKTLSKIEKAFVPTEQIKTWEEALEGAKAIIIERMVLTEGLRDQMAKHYRRFGIIEASKRKDAEKIKDYLKYKDYFEYSETISNLMQSKSSHRFLAIKRGLLQKVLKLQLQVDPVEIDKIVQKFTGFDIKDHARQIIIRSCSETAWKKYLHPSIEKELFSELKQSADSASIGVFGVNLKNLLLAPYLGSNAVMGIDPGVRTGCKVVVIDDTGKLLLDHVIYPHEPQLKKAESKKDIEQILATLKIQYIAIGNGTYGRETLAFIEDEIDAVKDGTVTATLVSESGASIYSASEVAKEEFPDKDVTVRGAVSIARRFQDPLSELVKIDPKSIGVGQYQHDVNQSKLQRNLKEVVEDCVNYVGVDLNTTSYHLLSYISGIGPKLAKNIVEFREKNGRFKKRTDLLNIARFTEKVFQQSAGFLRIYQGDHPLDSTFVHPERYKDIEAWCDSRSVNVIELLNKSESLEKLAKDNKLKEKIGELTFDDIVKSMGAPGQDPRKIFKSTDFAKGIRSLSDLSVGQWYTGVINNITNFGVFVDIGIKESGLVHISQLANKFVENPLEMVKVGEELKVRVMEVDLERKRLSLTCRTEEHEAAKKSDKPRRDRSKGQRNTGKSKNRAPKIPANSPFAALKNFKVK